MSKNNTHLDNLVLAAQGLTPSKFINWLEDLNPRLDHKLNIEILNRDEIFNINRDLVRLKVDKWVLVFDNGVFQRVEA